MCRRRDARGTRPVTDAETYTFDWFSHNIAVWQRHLSHLAGRPGLRGLEIGSFEGRSAVWLLRNVLTHPTARLECIEWFAGVWEWDGQVVDMAAVERRFDHNIRVANAEGRVTKIKQVSRVALRTRPLDSYDLIYIDGSHLAADVLEDAVLCFGALKTGGVMIFDDYQLMRDHQLDVPKLAIDAFLDVYRGRYDLVHTDYQVIIRKTAPPA
jgi:predicted O-methyltransferase YrrM